MSKIHTHNLLIVDDEPLVCWSLANTLQKAGFKVITTNTAEQAIDLLQTTQFDLVITDMKLPQKDGFEVVKAVQYSGSHTPIVMISAYGDTVAREIAKNFNIDYFIDKPLDLSQIVALAKQLTSLSD